MAYGDELGYEAETSFGAGDELRPLQDLWVYLREYSRERPEIAALTCFGIGFILGWKLKPW